MGEKIKYAEACKLFSKHPRNDDLMFWLCIGFSLFFLNKEEIFKDVSISACVCETLYVTVLLDVSQILIEMKLTGLIFSSVPSHLHGSAAP